MTLTPHATKALAVLRHIGGAHAPAALASSFGAEDMVLIDLIGRHMLPIRVFTLDTGRLHEETYALVDRVRDHYGLPITVMTPDTAELQALVEAHGVNPFPHADIAAGGEGVALRLPERERNDHAPGARNGVDRRRGTQQRPVIVDDGGVSN